MSGLGSSFERAGMGRSKEIARHSRELEGFPDTFAELSSEAQRVILEEVQRIKRLCGNDPERLIEVMRGVGKVCYEVTHDLSAGATHESMVRELSERLEEIEEELAHDNKPETRH